MSMSPQPSEGVASRWDTLKSVHIIGVCGTLMGAFASFLKRRGIEVTGSDQNVYPPMSDVLKGAGVSVFNGYGPENIRGLPKRPDLIVIGNVIRRENEEARFAIDEGYPYTSLPEFLEKWLLGETRNLVVSGTHGKTTTSSLLAHVLTVLNRSPSYFIGGVSLDLPHSFHVETAGHEEYEEQSYFVLEGDEYDTAFWDKVPKFSHYRPNDVILSSIEFDHADIYKNLDSVVSVFKNLVRHIRPEGRLIACTDYSEVKGLLKEASVPVLTYGAKREGNPDFLVETKGSSEGYSNFKIHSKKGESLDFQLQLSGIHNGLNALSVWIECMELGLDSKEVLQALRSFRGVKRRQEVRADLGETIVIDDFAHHPTAVRETLVALKSRYADRQLIAVFEPRSATSRRKIFQRDYARAFASADQVFIANAFDQSRIEESDRFSSQDLVADLLKEGQDAHLLETDEARVAQIQGAVRVPSVIAVLSNGGFGGLIEQLVQSMSKQ